MSGPISRIPVALPDSQPVKLLAVGCSALLATCLCFYMAVGLIHRELAEEIDITPAALASPAIITRYEEPRPPQRSRPERILPAEPPTAPGLLPANPPAEEFDLRAVRPTFGSLADLLGPDDIQLQLAPPVSDLVPTVIVQPIYPLAAVMKEIEGFVVVQFSVRENGTVANPIVLHSEPGVLFDQVALSAASRFKFKPRQIGTDPVAVENVQMKFAFTLDSIYDVPVEAMN